MPGQLRKDGDTGSLSFAAAKLQVNKRLPADAHIAWRWPCGNSLPLAADSWCVTLPADA